MILAPGCMADVGRWFAADPMAEANPGLSVYRYGFNNPVMFTDPNGMLEQALTNRMLELGGTWKNEGNGFESDEHIKLDYNGSYMNLNTNLDDNFNRIINIPGVNLAGKHNQWGQAFQDKFNSYMNSWNTNNFNNYIKSVMSQIQSSTSGNYVRATPDNPFANPSSQLGYNGLIAMQMSASGIATEFVAARTGLTFLSAFGGQGVSLSTTGSVAGDALGSIGVQTSFPLGTTKVGHWSPLASYNQMVSTGLTVTEQGGMTFFSTNGPNG